MFGAEANCRTVWLQSPIAFRNCISSNSRICLLSRVSSPSLLQCQAHSSSSLSSQFTPHFSPNNHIHKSSRSLSHFPLNASSSSVGSAEYTEEPATKVKFLTTLSLSECSGSLSLLGTGFREKVFAIIGVKVYAAGLYVNQAILCKLTSWKGQSATLLKEDSSLFSTIFQSSLEKSLQIVLVRDVDGKTFWDALNDAISPRIKSPSPTDESALSTFRGIFEGRPLKKGTLIFLTWLDPSKMLVSLSSDGLPSSVYATIESGNVSFSLFDVFFGDAPVSPSLKDSVANGLATILE